MAENKKIDIMSGEKLFEEIHELQQYSKAVNGVLVGSHIRSIQILEDLKKILNAKSLKELDKVLTKEISSVTADEIGLVRGDAASRIFIGPRLSIVKLTALLKEISRGYLEQSNLSVEQLRAFCKGLEGSFLELHKQGEKKEKDLNYKITGLLELLSERLELAAKKAGLFKRKDKKNFERGSDVVYHMILARRRDRRDDEYMPDIDVNKLGRVLKGEKEMY